MRVLRLSAMKILMAILVLALSISGYSAASHAMADANAVSSSSKAMTDSSGADLSSSADHSSTDQKTDKIACPNCLHSCSMLLMLPEIKHQLPEFSSTENAIEVSQFLPESQTFSLLRPPKILA